MLFVFIIKFFLLFFIGEEGWVFFLVFLFCWLEGEIVFRVVFEEVWFEIWVVCVVIVLVSWLLCCIVKFFKFVDLDFVCFLIVVLVLELLVLCFNVDLSFVFFEVNVFVVMNLFEIGGVGVLFFSVFERMIGGGGGWIVFLDDLLWLLSWFCRGWRGDDVEDWIGFDLMIVFWL